MSKKTAVAASEKEIKQQLDYIDIIAVYNRDFEQKNGKKPKAFTHTFGCQQNEADTERIVGMLHEMGYESVEKPEDANIIIYNTCAVREHAEQRALGNIGNLSRIKKERPDVTIGLCGCMVQQKHIPDKIKKSYPQVNLLFGTHMLWKFPELVYRRVVKNEKRVFDISGDDNGVIAEGLPVERNKGVKAWLSIMYGCNNFCTYCIVPYVRGRERSRNPDDIEKEFKKLVDDGYKEITLLGQNVNSYGKDLEIDIDFSDLLKRLNNISGDFLIRFMTSHPKDAGKKLFDTMAQCEKVAKQLHLPFQSGSNDVLKRMNRGYTAQHYESLIEYARGKMPDITLSSDVIVGFPNETEEDFEKTLELVEKIGFDMLFTFIYSKRSGTPAANYEDNVTREQKQIRFDRLLNLQDESLIKRQQNYISKKLRVLVDGTNKNDEYPYTARTEGGLLVCCKGDEFKIGEFATVVVEKVSLRCLFAVK